MHSICADDTKMLELQVLNVCDKCKVVARNHVDLQDTSEISSAGLEFINCSSEIHVVLKYVIDSSEAIHLDCES